MTHAHPIIYDMLIGDGHPLHPGWFLVDSGSVLRKKLERKGCPPIVVDWFQLADVTDGGTPDDNIARLIQIAEDAAEATP